MSLVSRNVLSARGQRTSMRLTLAEWEALAEVSQSAAPNLSASDALRAFVQVADGGRSEDVGRTEAVRVKLTPALFEGWKANQKAVAGDTEIGPPLGDRASNFFYGDPAPHP